MTSTQGIKLDEKTRKRLETLGKLRSRSPHWLMRAAIENYLNREEQYEREKREDMGEWERYQLTGEAVTQEAAAAWLHDLARGKVAPWPT